MVFNLVENHWKSNYKKDRKKHRSKYDVSALGEYIPAIQDGKFRVEVALEGEEQLHVESIIGLIRKVMCFYGDFQVGKRNGKIYILRKV